MDNVYAIKDLLDKIVINQLINVLELIVQVMENANHKQVYVNVLKDIKVINVNKQFAQKIQKD